MQNITAAESAELIASGSTSVSSPVLTPGCCGCLQWSVSSSRNLCASRYWNWKSCCYCCSSTVWLSESEWMSYSFRSCPVLQGSFLRHAAYLRHRLHLLSFHRHSGWISAPAAASSSCSPSSAVSASAVSVCSSDTTLPDRLTAIGWIKRETSEIR